MANGTLAASPATMPMSAVFERLMVAATARSTPAMRITKRLADRHYPERDHLAEDVGQVAWCEEGLCDERSRQHDRSQQQPEPTWAQSSE